jgi:pyruvate ferredoxin oxidoreductase alpha subunit
MEGSQAIADAVALCRPEVICAYPITPQTHIVEGLGERVKSGALKGCEFINVESEFAALSVAIGASAAGARSYTATASQGILYMAEAVYNAAGLGLPIVMTIGNRAIGAPINIWNDHSDSMSMRDAGWIQLYAETNQEAVDLHVLAFRLAEEISIPVMVCVDGFILTHAYERVDIPPQEDVDRFVPPFEPTQVLDVADPVSMGAMVGPEAFFEVRYLQHERQSRALELIPRLAREFRKIFGRDSIGLVHPYRCDDAETIMVSLGSVNGTIKEAVDDLRNEGLRVGALSICSFRPFPLLAVRSVLERAARVVVLEKSLSVGIGGPLSEGVRKALSGSDMRGYTVIAGLGGRALPKSSIARLFQRASRDELPPLDFLDLNWDVVRRELGREREQRRAGPTAENILKDVGREQPARGQDLFAARIA